MKYLEAQKQAGKQPQPSIIGEHKMRGGLDPKDPESLVSSPHRASTREVRNAAQSRTQQRQGQKVDESTLDES